MIFHVRTFTHDKASVRFGLVLDILPDGVFRHGTNCFHIAGVVPQLSFPQLLPRSGYTSNSFLPVIPFKYFTISVTAIFGGADTKQCI
jgi:hypothetical protein